MAGKLTYKDAGVDIDLASTFLKQISQSVRRTYGTRVIDSPNGFAGMFALDSPGALFKKKYRRPVLVSCTDGVGTKLKVALLMERHSTVGIDLVAMSVNDLIVTGAEPLFFLDYVAMSKLTPQRLVDVVKGISDGCMEAGISLIGGETAELPGVYKRGEYDLVGFAVGVVERSKIIDGSKIEVGDKLVGIASSGLHSNGYSLARKVLLDHAKLKPRKYVPELGTTLGEELLRPTAIYVKTIQSLQRGYKVKCIIRGMAHITGGGLTDNVPRVLPKGCGAKIDKASWIVPPIFQMIQRLGNVDEEEMYRTFNMGIGMVLVVPPYNVSAVMRRLKRLRRPAFVIGEVTRGKPRVDFV